MGNCLKCGGGGQQDNTTLLNNSPDPALTSGSSQEALGPPPPYNEIANAYYPPIGTRDRHQQSTELAMGRGIVGLNPIGGVGLSDEEQQVRIAKRIGLIQHLPTGEYDGTKKGECVICMMELVTGEEVRYLPCMHTYHAVCIDDWLLRSLTCPSCMEPVDAALINSYYATT